MPPGARSSLVLGHRQRGNGESKDRAQRDRCGLSSGLLRSNQHCAKGYCFKYVEGAYWFQNLVPPDRRFLEAEEFFFLVEQIMRSESGLSPEWAKRSEAVSALFALT